MCEGKHSLCGLRVMRTRQVSTEIRRFGGEDPVLDSQPPGCQNVGTAGRIKEGLEMTGGKEVRQGRVRRNTGTWVGGQGTWGPTGDGRRSKKGEGRRALRQRPERFWEAQKLRHAHSTFRHYGWVCSLTNDPALPGRLISCWFFKARAAGSQADDEANKTTFNPSATPASHSPARAAKSGQRQGHS